MTDEAGKLLRQVRSGRRLVRRGNRRWYLLSRAASNALVGWWVGSYVSARVVRGLIAVGALRFDNGREAFVA